MNRACVRVGAIQPCTLHSRHLLALPCDLKVQGEELQELEGLGQETMLEKNLRDFLGSGPTVPQICEADREPDRDFRTGR